MLKTIIAVIFLLANFTNTNLANKELFEKFKDSEAILNFPKRYYHFLLENREKLDYEDICILLEDYNINELSLKNYFYLDKIFKELNCDHDTTLILEKSENYLKSDNLLFFYYAFFIQNSLNKNFYTIIYCEQVEKFRQRGALFSSGPRSKDFNYYLTSIALEILYVCAQKEKRFKTEIELILKDSLKDLTQVTKNTRAWMNNQFTFFTTMRMMNFILDFNINLLDEKNWNLIMNYIYKHKPYDMNYQEKTQYFKYEENLLEKNILIIGIPENIYLIKCAAKCKIKINKFLPDYNIDILTSNNKQINGNINKKGEILISRKVLSKIDHFKIKISSRTKYFLQRDTINVIKTNKIEMIRADINNEEKMLDLIDSENTKCQMLNLKANLHNFLHFGFKTRYPSLFYFVYLKPLNEKFESSTPINAILDYSTGLYVSSIDLGDYYTILPNSGIYQIYILLNNGLEMKEEIPCGKIDITFNSKEISKKIKMNISPIVELKNFENKALPKKISRITLFYFGLMVFVSILAYYAYMKELYDEEKYKKLKKESWNFIIVKYSLFFIFFTIIFFAFRFRLLENFWLIFLQVFIFSFICGKNL